MPYYHEMLPNITEIPIKNSISGDSIAEPYSYYKNIYGQRVTNMSLALSES